MADGCRGRERAAEDLTAKNKKLLLCGKQRSFCGLHGGPKTVRSAHKVFGKLCFKGIVEDVGGGVWAARGWTDKAAV